MFLFHLCYVPVQEQEGREHLIPSISTNCGNCIALPALDCVSHWISSKKGRACPVLGVHGAGWHCVSAPRRESQPALPLRMPITFSTFFSDLCSTLRSRFVWVERLREAPVTIHKESLIFKGVSSFFFFSLTNTPFPLISYSILVSVLGWRKQPDFKLTACLEGQK